jgi:hypothetical protein
VKPSKYLKDPAMSGAAKTPFTTFAASVQTAVFPKTLHQFRPDPKATQPNPKPPSPGRAGTGGR